MTGVMEPVEDCSRIGFYPITTARNVSSSSSVFFSADQSPFFSPKSPTGLISESMLSDLHTNRGNLSRGINSGPRVSETDHRPNTRNSAAVMSKGQVANISDDPQKLDRLLSSTSLPSSTTDSCSYPLGNGFYKMMKEQRNYRRGQMPSCTSVSTSLSSNRLRSCDVFIGIHGRKPSLLRFSSWLRAELELHGMSCFVSDRARYRNPRKHGNAERAMELSSYGIVVITKSSFKNRYTIEELRYFAHEKNLVPLFFDLGPDDCLVRDIVEKRGEMWENYGGELWHTYGGLEEEWKEAVTSLSRVDEWKLEAQDGNWRDCILRAVMLIGMRLGRRSVVERLTKWREKTEKEEFPFPRNESFVGRKKELSELELMLFGDVSGDSEDYFELKTRHKRKNSTIEWNRFGLAVERRHVKHQRSSKKGKESVLWKESKMEIEMHSNDNSERGNHVRLKNGGVYGKRKRVSNTTYGKGIACISGETGIGKTELLLEFAYRYHQRYKMVLWIGGENHYIRQNYLHLRFLFENYVGVENCSEKSRIKSFEEQEEEAIFNLRKELMKDIPYLLIIDNLESEKDWWDHKHVMDLLPRFGGETHIIVSTRLPQVMNLEPLRLSYLSAVEAMSLMQGTIQEYSMTEVDALRSIEEKLGRLTLGLGIVGAILSELPINPSRLLDTINRMPVKEMTWTGRDSHTLSRNVFLLQLFEVCFSIFDHADGPKSLATRIVLASSWFAPTATPISLLAQAANRIPNDKKGSNVWRRLMSSVSCGLTETYKRRPETEACSMLIRFNIARSSSKSDYIYVNDIIKLYSRKRGIRGVPQAMVHAVISRGSLYHHAEHVWAASFLLFGFVNDSKAVDVKVSELLHFVKELALPLAIQAFITFSRCKAALELLRLCTNALEMADQEFVTPVDKWLDKSLCWRTIQTNAQLNPYLWQELALCRASVLEMRAKLMLRGGQFEIGDDLIRKAIFIRTSICGENHPDTLSARETLNKLTRLLVNLQPHTSPMA